jgi:N-acetylglutamate synthase-like GNAT family acetyltransferase
MSENIIKDYTLEDYDKVIEFLESVTTLKNIEEELFDNSIIIEKEDKVVGMISYEIFRGRALIRYFIFDKNVKESYLVNMYEKFFNKLKENDIEQIFVIISKDIIVDMFENLGFVEFDKDDFFLTESNIRDTKYSDSKVMCYHIE